MQKIRLRYINIALLGVAALLQAYVMFAPDPDAHFAEGELRTVKISKSEFLDARRAATARIRGRIH